MSVKQFVRRRGVFLTSQGQQKLDAARRKVERTTNNGHRFTLEELCDRAYLSIKTITKILDGQTSVDRQSLDYFFSAFGLTLEKSDYYRPGPEGNLQPVETVVESVPAQVLHLDWGEAPDISHFFGRQTELTQLKQWVQTDRCRTITVLGMGGIGKTTLVTKLLHELIATEHNFDYVIWRSLRNAPSPDTILSDWLSVVSQYQETQPDSKCLLNYLKQHRCLLVLDNLETVLDRGQNGVYRPGYEGYGDLLRLLGETLHQSCLIVTSREKVLELIPLEGKTFPVRSFVLKGSPKTTLDLLQIRGIVGTLERQQQLCFRYSNNPLAIQLVAATIRDLFDGDLEAFLQQDALLFTGLRRLLDQQFERLSQLQESIMVWLTINRDWTTIDQLMADLLPKPGRDRVLAAIENLYWRDLIEKQQGSYTQQPIIMEYVTERLTEQVSDELLQFKQTGFLPDSYCQRYALLKTTVQDYIRTSQNRLILEPVCQQLQAVLGSRSAIITRLKTKLAQLTKLASQTELAMTDQVEASYAPGNLLNLLCYLEADLTAINVSGLAIWHAYLSDIPLIRANFAGTDLRNTVFSDVFDAVFTLAFNPDGTQFATGEMGGHLRVRDVTTGNVIWSVQGYRSWIWSLAFSPNGKFIATGTGDGLIGIWEATQGILIQQIADCSDQVYSVVFNPTGELLASASGDGTVRIWEVASWQCLRVIPAHTDKVWSIAFSPSGNWLASGGSDREIHLWSVETGEHLLTLKGHSDQIHAVAFHPQGDLLASASADYTIKLWQLSNGQLVRTLTGHVAPVLAVSFSPDGRILASSGNDETVRLWDILSGQAIRVLQGHLNWVRSVDFSPDGATLLSGGTDYSVWLWDVGKGYVLKTWRGYSNWIWDGKFSRDGKTILSGGGNRAICIWNVASRELQQTLRGHKNWVRAICFTNNLDLVASGGGKEIYLWQLPNSRVIDLLQGHTGQVASLRINLAGNLLISGSNDYTARLWNLDTKTILHIYRGHTDWIRDVAFSPDEHQIATASHDKTARLWNIETGQCLHCFDQFDTWVWSVDFHPQQPLIAIASGNELSLWNLETYQCLYRATEHTSWVRCVRFSPDGKYLATGSQDGQVILWEVASQQICHVMTQDNHYVLSVGFSPNGQYLLSTTTNGTLHLWEVATGTCWHTFKAERLCEGMNITNIRGLSERSIYVMLKQLGAIDTN